MPTRIQLCGRLAAQIAGQRIEGLLPGHQGRLLFAYLAANRLRAATRDELMEAVWPRERPRVADAAFSALVSKVRRVLGTGRLEGRADLRLVLPEDAWLDVEAASVAVHRAEAAVARADWCQAWVASRIAQHICVRPFLAGEDAPWVEERRRQLEGVYLTSLEIAAHASLELRGSEIDTAERSARALVHHAPYRESGYRYLMEALAARDNRAEALQVYERLRSLLRDELGAAPSPATQELHKRLLA